MNILQVFKCFFLPTMYEIHTFSHINTLAHILYMHLKSDKFITNNDILMM